MKSTALYVATNGNDGWSGTIPDPNADKTDGPMGSLNGARDRIRQLRKVGAPSWPITVSVRGGRYALKQPLVFTHDDSFPVVYQAYPNETPILDGGVKIDGWKKTKVNGKNAWVTTINDVRAGVWYFRSLFVNGERRLRPQLPKRTKKPIEQTFLRMKGVPGVDLKTAELFEGMDRFYANKGDIKNWKNITDVDVVVLHYWVEARLPIASFDPKTSLVISTHFSQFALKDDWSGLPARYYVENVFEALTEPGEWYLDRPTGKLYYVPLPGEKIETTEVFAPKLTQLLEFKGDTGKGQFVDNIAFKGFTFRNTDWHLTEYRNQIRHEAHRAAKLYGGAPQASTHLPGTISLKAARSCAIENCTIEHIGFYGIDLSDGCRGNRLVANTIHDTGGGAIKQNGGDSLEPVITHTGKTSITDNHLYDLGKIFHSAIGVISMHAFGNDISHNHIHDLFYSGISVGWVWGYADSVSKDNRVEFNHIHDLGRKWLSDMGGIYTLGVQPGTTLRNNYIHDIEKANYGGWAIYPDEGSSHIIIENNLCHSTSSQPFHIHYGREIVVQNNIFAFGREGQIALSRYESHRSLIFQKNIVVCDGQPVFVGGYNGPTNKMPIQSDWNLFFDINGKLDMAVDKGKVDVRHKQDEWQKRGHDLHSLFTDPKFVNLKKFDFTLAKNSPVLALGFKPIDLSQVGVRRATLNE